MPLFNFFRRTPSYLVGVGRLAGAHHRLKQTEPFETKVKSPSARIRRRKAGPLRSGMIVVRGKALLEHPPQDWLLPYKGIEPVEIRLHTCCFSDPLEELEGPGVCLVKDYPVIHGYRSDPGLLDLL